MRIGIELRPIQPQGSGGIVQLLQGVFAQLFRLGREHLFFVYHTGSNAGLVGPPAEHVRHRTLDADTFWWELDQHLGRDRVQVLFRSYPVEEKLFFPAGNQVVLVPDLQHEEMPDCFAADVLARRRAAFGPLIREAGAIAVLAEYGRSVLLRHYPHRRRDDVFLLSPALPLAGADVRDAPLDPADEALIPRSPFFLFPANLWPHKNHRRLLAAFACFRQRPTGQPFSLVFTGDPAGWPELRAEYPDLPAVHLGYVSKRLLAELYRRATALTYFSLYEGFGIPLLEAFSFGTPVLCSTSSSLPEVGGDAVLSCEPTDVEAMAGLMERIAADGSLRATLAERGSRRLPLYGWEQPARNLLDAFLGVGLQPVDHLAVLDGLTQRLQVELAARLDVILGQDKQLVQMQQAMLRLHEEISRVHLEALAVRRHCAELTRRLEESQRKSLRLKKAFTRTPFGLLYKVYRRVAKRLKGPKQETGPGRAGSN
jgi:glycosyltransferase involved in cell wall biosynthesis